MGQSSSQRYKPLQDDSIELSEAFRQVPDVEDWVEKDGGDTEKLLTENSVSETRGKRQSKMNGLRLPDPSAANLKRRRCVRGLLLVGSLTVAALCTVGLVFLLPCKETTSDPPAGENSTSHLKGPSSSADIHVPPSAAVDGTSNVSITYTTPTHKAAIQPRLLHWKTSRLGIGTEGPIRLLDVNHDGTLDVIGVYVSGDANSALTKSMHGGSNITRALSPLRECVRSHDPHTFDPCGGGVAAFDGGTGQLLWYSPSYMEVFALTCHGIDINQDGQDDCLAGGRVGVLYAIDSTDGHLLWEGDRQAINSSWNVFTPALIGDLDDDGIDEILIANGGNQQYRPSQRDRDAGQLLVLRGKTGKSIGRGFHMPDGGETYMSPVILTLQDGTKVVLFGSGGETIGGSLWAVRLIDLVCYMINGSSELPTFDCSKIDAWDWAGHHADHFSHGIPLHELVKSRQRGVMVPPVLVDLTDDTVDEIVGSTFGGYVFAIDGATRDIVWERYMPGTQSYSSPAPAFFNDDTVPDIMLQIVTGDWTYNNYTMTESIIVDGTHGQTLWSMRSRLQMMESPLSLVQLGNKHNSWFLFWVSGRVSWPGAELKSFLPGASGEVKNLGDLEFVSIEDALEGVNTQPSNIDPWRTENDATSVPVVASGSHAKRHSDEEDQNFDHESSESHEFIVLLHDKQHKPADYDDAKPNAKCGVNEDIFTTELFAVDSTHALSPVKLVEARSFSSKGKTTSNPESKRHEPVAGKNVCSQFRPSIRGTMAVGDLNGDGLIEIAVVKAWSSYVLIGGSYDHMEYSTSFEVLTVQLNASYGIQGSFLPVDEQPWAGYMGTRADSSYSRQ